MGRFHHRQGWWKRPIRVNPPAPGHTQYAPSRSCRGRRSVGGKPVSSTLFRTKKVEQSILDTEEPEHALKKSLSALDLTVFGVGVIIGTGIFVLTGTVAKNNAGPAVALAF